VCQTGCKKKVQELCANKNVSHCSWGYQKVYTLAETLNVVCSAEDLPCVIPNCPNKAKEWQYIKHRKRIKGKASIKISASTAKQIAVCKEHYLLIHNAKYDGPSLRKLRGYTPSDFA
jgi:hypothetical protein